MNATDRALAQFVDDLDKDLVDLSLGISDALPERYVEVSVLDEPGRDAKGRSIVKGVIYSRPDDEIADAFKNFDWLLKRRLRELKETLQREATVDE